MARSNPSRLASAFIPALADQTDKSRLTRNATDNVAEGRLASRSNCSPTMLITSDGNTLAMLANCCCTAITSTTARRM